MSDQPRGTVGLRIRCLHPDSFRSPEWATITGFVGPPGEPEPCYRVVFEDGIDDFWAIDDDWEYEFAAPEWLNQKLTLNDLQRLDLRHGDVLVVRWPELSTYDEVRQAQCVLQELFDGLKGSGYCRVLVLPTAGQLGILGRPEAAGD